MVKTVEYDLAMWGNLVRTHRGGRLASTKELYTLLASECSEELCNILTTFGCRRSIAGNPPHRTFFCVSKEEMENAVSLLEAMVED